MCPFSLCHAFWGTLEKPCSSSGPQFPHSSVRAYIAFPVNTSSHIAVNLP